jgi:hypothetical protein
LSKTCLIFGRTGLNRPNVTPLFLGDNKTQENYLPSQDNKNTGVVYLNRTTKTQKKSVLLQDNKNTGEVCIFTGQQKPGRGLYF